MNEEQLRAELAAVYASKSWKMTAPFRLTMTMVYEFRAFVRNPRPLVGAALRRAGKYSAVRRHGGSLLRHFPALHRRVQRIVFAPPPASVGLTYSPVLVVSAAEPAGDPPVPANDASIAAPADVQIAAPADVQIAPAGPEAGLSLAARTVLAELRAAQRRFR